MVLTPYDVSITEIVSAGDKNGLRLLLAGGADPNQTNKSGQTPLILTIVSGHLRLLPLLIDSGADPLLRDNTGLNAVDWAERKGLPEVAKFLRDRSSEIPETPVSQRESKPESREPLSDPSGSMAPADVDRRSLSDVDKSRRWIAGIKQRLDEKAGRSQLDAENGSISNSPNPQSEPVNESPTYSSREVEAKSESLELSPTTSSSAQKKCPQCNTVYNSDLVAYCAYHVVPLVDIDTPVEIPKDDNRKTLLLWLLIVLTFLSAALLGFALFSPWDSLTNNVVAPSSISPSTPAWKGIPVANGQLKAVVVDLPVAETDFHTAKEETIVVRVKIDGSGYVASVDSRLGNDELRRAAMVAARKATFSAEKLRGKETAGTISYTFTP